ncbi:protein AmbC [Ktedonobacter sp. SOSP1-52]|uniref:TauD/TfdA family dioxygenase n=1 Tax=Ktedonobacter sp. SOSP1-52 TaxID=2778366 RepID=UPI001916140F|nr:TauD/TfdA family dioxygenase [Ktedonobacter sp. SOSP1-52]GHO70205.1 protein AmbC [Ktedonobacter sp. SOSP1-52]
MTNTQRDERNPRSIKSIKRKAVTTANTSQEALVKVGALDSQGTLPLLVQPAVDDLDLINWSTHNQPLIESYLLKYGGILFRGFALKSADDFEAFITGATGSTLEYHEQSSPRSLISGNIYTSTDYPADQSIFFHNESSYRQTWPLRIAFFCQTPPTQGGETPIADVGKVYEHIDPQIRERFQQKGVLYVRNYGDGIGLPWQTVFQTSSREVVEEFCQQAGIQCKWKGENRLRTYRVGPAVVPHPKTGQPLWFNHATFFHVTTLGPEVSGALLKQFAEEDLPGNTYYGDGSPIEDSTLDALRQAYTREIVKFPWQKGDVLLLDNMQVAHARSPFTGPRRILTGMSLPFTARS